MKTVKVAAIGLAVGLGGLMAAPASAQEYTAVMQRDIKWQDAPSIGPGAKTAVIDGDPKSSGPFVMRLKLPPKTTIGVHTHPTTESVTVLSGTLYFAAGDKLDPKAAKAFGPGSFFSIGQGKPMFAYTTDKEVTLQLHGMDLGGSHIWTPRTRRRRNKTLRRGMAEWPRLLGPQAFETPAAVTILEEAALANPAPPPSCDSVRLLRTRGPYPPMRSTP